MWSARWKLVSLWFSQVARVTADTALFFFVVLDAVRQDAAQASSAWYLTLALFMLPALLLAPLSGALCNRLAKGRVLFGLALFNFLVVVVFAFVPGPWWVLVAFGSAIYGPTRDALLPAASEDTRWPLTRINGIFAMGAAGAMLGGMLLILGTDACKTPAYPLLNLALLAIAGLNLGAFLFALPVSFVSDVYRTETSLQALPSFFHACRAIGREREARTCLLGLSGLRGLLIGLFVTLLPIPFTENGTEVSESVRMSGWVVGGLALGALLAGTQKHPRRVLGFVPWGSAGLTMALICAAKNVPGDVLCVLFGIMAGLVQVPLAAVYQNVLPPDARGNGMAVCNMTGYLCAALTAVSLFLLAYYGGGARTVQWWLVASVAGVATLVGWWIFRREVTEQLIEVLFAFMYRFRAVGPGLDRFPLRGPVIVVANHTAWMDPMWLAKVLPRALIPMMTSVYFDHPLLRWTMIYLAEAIRVESSGFRREVPELQTAIDALDAGKCLVLFPEGRLRRKEETPLKMFGQGIWHILRERPHTPVVVCWIEGGWGSFFSYFRGPPTKNKRFDIRRPLGIAVGAPQVLSEEILADHRLTRQYLMRQCAEMRQHLGLEPLQAPFAEEETSETE